MFWHYFGLYLYSFLTVLLLGAGTPKFPPGENWVLSYLILSYVVNELIDCLIAIAALKHKHTFSAKTFKQDACF